ncbi:MAG TPA: glycosyltransferase family 2 protein [Candidatus Alectryocaccobium stercorigallinarum]|nr:glycosyltransferase family 2 protein [Candidatus Alectryocaccobium stercorigallinarum]
MNASSYDIIISTIGAVCGLLFAYQLIYAVIALFKKTPEFTAKRLCSYAILIAARNEEKVIGNLIESILSQDYPKELFKIFVVADNCSDKTAAAAKEHGAVVYERLNGEQKGKGYALNYLLKQIAIEHGLNSFDGYLVFDADNLLDESYLTEINKVFSNGYKICTSYRNSKNYGANWISAASGLWFIREARHLNHARMLLNISCLVSGTGYVMHRDIILRNGGWNFFSLTEDAEFSVDSIIKGETIGYCESAIFYDEQPTRLSDTVNQRLRWCKGMCQVLMKNRRELAEGLFCSRAVTFFDTIITLAPGIIFFSVCTLTALLMSCKCGWNIGYFIPEIIELTAPMLAGSYIMFYIMGLSVLITEHKKIYCNSRRAFLLLFAFPLFMLMYAPISVIALFAKVKWTPVRHTFACTSAQMETLK